MSGDLEFTELFHELYPRLCGFLGVLLGDSRRAEELAQESLLRLHRSAMRRAAAEDIRNWIFRVARNLALNERKREARAPRTVPLRLIPDPAASTTPETELQHRQELDRVGRLVRSLPEQQRAALLLREREAMSYDAIARVLNISIDNVKVSIFRARRALRDGATAAEARA